MLRRISDSDEAALGTLYDRYRAVLFGLLTRILHDQAEAEDVLQEVFVQVWQRGRNFDSSRGKVSTWLIMLTRSRGIDRLRSLKSRSFATLEQTDKRSINFVSNGTESMIERERGRLVREALSELPEDQRNTLLLAYFDGFSHSEIAERTGTPLGTVKTRMRAGMTKLREALASDLRAAA